MATNYTNKYVDDNGEVTYIEPSQYVKTATVSQGKLVITTTQKGTDSQETITLTDGTSVTASDTGTSTTDIKYLTIDGTEYRLAGAVDFGEYQEVDIDLEEVSLIVYIEPAQESDELTATQFMEITQSGTTLEVK